MDRVVSIDITDLENASLDLTTLIEKAYGRDGLGILVVTNVPGYVAARQRLLPQARTLAGQSEEVLKGLEDEQSSYSFGWSHGKEMLEGGKKDLLKGSFYANPLHDTVTEDVELMKQHPSYARANVWPSEQVPDLEGAFKDLGQLIIRTGHSVAKRCDEYILKETKGNAAAAQCADVIERSPCPKGRLLHYFPADPNADDGQQWCGWHNDHGSLTGLCSAMFINAEGKEVPNPDSTAGLYIRDRSGEIIKVSIPKDALAYQMGESLQILSGGLLNATPHYVQGARPSVKEAHGVSRNTLAVFMQPHWDDKLCVPEGMPAEGVKPVVAWKEGQSFGEFTNVKLGQYYVTADEVVAK